MKKLLITNLLIVLNLLFLPISFTLADSAEQTVKRIFDGDTLQLTNGQKIRFLGINTPEIAHYGKSGDMLGDEAKQWLIQKIADKPVHLELDVERQDHYGRNLAYVFNYEGENLNVALVGQGLASVTIFPPNLRYVDALLDAQDQAEQANKGIWQALQYRVIDSQSLNTQQSYSGWQRIRGVVNSVKHSKNYDYLIFSPNFSARIASNNCSLFPDLRTYINKRIEVRGWLNKHQGHFSMLLRHPSAIK